MLQSAETCELLYGAALQGTTLASPTWQIASGSVVLTANRAAPRLVHHTPIQPRSSPGLSRVLSATGRDDPRATCAELLGRALAALPAPARAGRIRLRDAGYFAGQLARAALLAGVEFAIGARRTAPLWRLLDGVPDQAWTDAIDMTGAQVAVADYCPNWWPATTRLRSAGSGSTWTTARSPPTRERGAAAPCTQISEHSCLTNSPRSTACSPTRSS